MRSKSNWFLAFDHCGARYLAPQRPSTKNEEGELLSDDGPKMKKKTKKNNFNAGLDKVGFIEAQGLPGFTLGNGF